MERVLSTTCSSSSIVLLHLSQLDLAVAPKPFLASIALLAAHSSHQQLFVMLQLSPPQLMLHEIARAARPIIEAALEPTFLGCEGGAAHQRWKRVGRLKHDQTKHIRDVMVVMACASNYYVASAW